MNDTAYLLALIRQPDPYAPGRVSGVACDVTFDVFSEERPSNFNDCTWATIHKIKAVDFEEACLRMDDYVTSSKPWIRPHLHRFNRLVDGIRRRRRGEVQFVPGV